jgi:hypothetical protein
MRATKPLGAAAAAILVAGMVMSPAPLASDDGVPGCTVRSIAGRWLFGTGMGEVFLGPFTGQSITAIGTMNIDRQGNVSGRFDNNIATFGAFTGNTYTGTVAVNGDCTGMLQFTTSSGSQRTDSIAIVGHGEIWGMSLDPENPWTYVVRRIGGKHRPDRD